MVIEELKHQLGYTSDGGLDHLSRKWRKAINLCISVAAFKAAGGRHQSRKDESVMPSSEASTRYELPKVEHLIKSRHMEPFLIKSDNRQSPSVSSEKSGHNILVLDPHNNMALHQPRTRHLSPSGREHAKRMRKVGACSDCREKKKRVY